VTRDRRGRPLRRIVPAEVGENVRAGRGSVGADDDPDGTVELFGDTSVVGQ
jgi:hypothetical protein